MTALSIAIPYARVSPLYLPRRDLVLDAADSLSLAVTVMESDAPDAVLIDLTTGPTFPTFTLQIWQDSVGGAWDYGGFSSQAGTMLREVEGVISDTWPGTVDFTVPATTLAAWPIRCGWSIRMDHDDTLSETLMAGTLHVRGSRAGSSLLGGTFILDDLRGLGVLG